MTSLSNDIRGDAPSADVWLLRDDTGTEREFQSREKAEEQLRDLEAMGATLWLIAPNGQVIDTATASKSSDGKRSESE